MRHRAGDTWSFVGIVTINDVCGNKIDLSGWKIYSQLRSMPGLSLVDTAVCEWIDVSTGAFSHRCKNTSAWPIGPVCMDIVLVSPNGELISTDSEKIDVVAGVTRL